MRYLAATCLFLSLSASPAAADTASHRAAVEEFLTTINADRITDNYVQVVKNSFAQGFQQAGGTPAQSGILNKHWSDAEALLRSELAWPKIKEEVLDIYVAAFTEAEARELVAFYTSPVGRKALERMPQLSQQTAQLGQARLRETQARMQAIADRMLAELRPKP